MNPQEICEHCKFFDKSEQLTKQFGYDAGYCHRFPPTTQKSLEKDGFVFVYTKAPADYWCGEFQQGGDSWKRHG